jgi:hypothetical protein
MNRRPTMTLEDVRRAIEAQDKARAEAIERLRASGVRTLPVSPAQLYRFAEACEVKTPAAPPKTGLREWSALRC